jgi:hypothetical protein
VPLRRYRSLTVAALIGAARVRKRLLNRTESGGQSTCRDAAGHVTFDAYAMNGRRTVTLLEKEGLLQVERQRRDLRSFLNEMHTVTVQNQSQQLVIRMWSWYTEFAIWSLLLMSVSGVYLWLASRPGHRWAQASFGLGTGIFLALYFWSR